MRIEDATRKVSELKPGEKILIRKADVEGASEMSLMQISEKIMLKATLGYSVEVEFDVQAGGISFHKIRHPVEEFIAHLEGLQPEHRVGLIDKVTERFCLHCGTSLAHARCQCSNDE